MFGQYGLDGETATVLATVVALTAIVGAACVPGPSIVAPSAIPIPAWTPHDARRGIDLSPKTPLSVRDYQALDLVQPGSVVLFSAQLGDVDPLHWMGNDPQLQQWLRAHQDVIQIVRMWPVRGPEDPRRLAQRIVKLHFRFPWITWFQIANEPDIEWASPSWQSIGDWSISVWWNVERYRRAQPGAAPVRRGPTGRRMASASTIGRLRR